MYTRYFGLAEKPFAISPNPRYLFMSELHREALAHLLYGVNSDGCFILLTGDVGTGKTTVCRCLLTQLPEHTDLAIILNPKLTASELLRTICEELGILPEGDADSVKAYIDILNRHLLSAHARGRTTVVIIDEAQNLDMNVLEQLRLLTNLETNTQKLLQIVLIGQPELRDLLERPELSQLNQRVTSRYHLTPLSPEDVHTYILHRLAVAGGNNKKLFSAKAVRYIAKVTNGIPRLINVLCDRALLGAYAESEDHVSYKIAKKAGTETFSSRPKQGRALRAPATIATIAVLVCLLLSALYFSPLIKEQIIGAPQPAVIEELMQPVQESPRDAASAPTIPERPASPDTTRSESYPAKQATGQAEVNEQLYSIQIDQSRNQELQQGILIATAHTDLPANSVVHQFEQPRAIQTSPIKPNPKLEHSGYTQESRQPDSQ